MARTSSGLRLSSLAMPAEAMGVSMLPMIKALQRTPSAAALMAVWWVSR
jgi:hypothetical protein